MHRLHFPWEIFCRDSHLSISTLFYSIRPYKKEKFVRTYLYEDTRGKEIALGNARHASGWAAQLVGYKFKETNGQQIRLDRSLRAARGYRQSRISPLRRCSYNAASAGHGNCISWIDFVARARPGSAPNRPPRSPRCRGNSKPVQMETTAAKKGEREVAGGRGKAFRAKRAPR